MNLKPIVEMLDAEIARLQRARSLLAGLETAAPLRRGRPTGKVSQPAAAAPAAGRLPISDAGKASIAAAQKKRWARKRAAEKQASTGKALNQAVKASSAKTAPMPGKAARAKPGPKPAAGRPPKKSVKKKAAAKRPVPGTPEPQTATA